MPDLLPPNATPQERAISLAVDRLPTVPIKTLWTPQTCPEAQLPWLAWALSVDDWDATWPVETKRQVIADSIEQHRKKGTVGALRRALQRLGYEVEIDEATGVAYTFRLRVRVRAGDSAGGAVAEDALNRSVTVALRQKNARSALLETLYVAETDAAGLFIGGVTMSGLSYEAKVTADYTLPPSALTITQTGAATVSAAWTGDGEYYEIEISYFDAPSGLLSIVNTFNSYTNSITDLSVLASRVGLGYYTFRIRLFSGGNFSQWTSTTFDVDVLPPTDVTADNESSGGLDVSWTNLEAEAEIEIRYSSAEDWLFIPFYPTSLASNNANYSGLSTGVYDVRVRSKNTAYTGDTVYSDWVEVLNIEVD
jgi:phage tail P2-like protein